MQDFQRKATVGTPSLSFPVLRKVREKKTFFLFFFFFSKAWQAALLQHAQEWHCTQTHGPVISLRTHFSAHLPLRPGVSPLLLCQISDESEVGLHPTWQLGLVVPAFSVGGDLINANVLCIIGLPMRHLSRPLAPNVTAQ